MQSKKQKLLLLYAFAFNALTATKIFDHRKKKTNRLTSS